MLRVQAGSLAVPRRCGLACVTKGAAGRCALACVTKGSHGAVWAGVCNEGQPRGDGVCLSTGCSSVGRPGTSTPQMSS